MIYSKFCCCNFTPYLCPARRLQAIKTAGLLGPVQPEQFQQYLRSVGAALADKENVETEDAPDILAVRTEHNNTDQN
jgi:hypothetical protein